MQNISMSKIFLRYLRYILCDLCIAIFGMYISHISINIIISGTVYGPNSLVDTMLLSLCVGIITCVLYAIFGVYNILWRFAGLNEFATVVFATMLSAVISTVLLIVFNSLNFISVNIFVLFVEFVFIIGFVILSRISIKAVSSYLSIKNSNNNFGKSDENILVIGAGQAADILLREYISHNKIANVKCVIDDDESKLGASIHGVKIVGNRDYIEKAIKVYGINVVIFAIPSLSQSEKKELYDRCKNFCKTVKSVPNISDIVDDSFTLASIKDLKVEDLIGRDPIVQNQEVVKEYISGKCILITGGGGSIGSELCRQIVKYSPKKLVIVDIYENNAYDIQQELLSKYQDLDLSVEIASVRDKQRLLSIFNKHRPDTIYHAAAHKHVPLMENSPLEAVKNNVFGTYNTATAACECGVKRFVMISTDKAVNPTNVMGATKRICEMIIQSMNGKTKTEFVAVRFGNVLGSNGSVIPLFKKQIEKGGPVTVTHPEIIRYFMTIPEAASLVLQAGASAKGGEIFILDMGHPVKILELAENVIRLSGYVPYKDIDIQFTGLRPGEKLYEELLLSEEGITKTDNDLIFIGKPIEFDENEFYANLERLGKLEESDVGLIRELISKIVPTYKYMKEE